MTGFVVPRHDVLVQHDVEATMRDGVVLRANVYRPAGDGRYPVLLSRQPYNKDLNINLMYADCENGGVRLSESGLMAIWSDIAAEDETDYLHWLSREHTHERVGIAGFRSARVLRAIEPGMRRYLILYELDSAQVLASQQYLARLDAPTAWSQRIMPRLANFARGGGQVVEAGVGWGGFVAPLRLSARLYGDSGYRFERALVDRLVACDRIAAVRLVVVDSAATDIPTAEKAMRQQDDSFACLLLVEGLDDDAVFASIYSEPDLRQYVDRHVSLYSTVFALPTPEGPLPSERQKG